MSPDACPRRSRRATDNPLSAFDSVLLFPHVETGFPASKSAPAHFFLPGVPCEWCPNRCSISSTASRSTASCAITPSTRLFKACRVLGFNSVASSMNLFRDRSLSSWIGSTFAIHPPLLRRVRQARQAVNPPRRPPCSTRSVDTAARCLIQCGRSKARRRL